MRFVQGFRMVAALAVWVVAASSPARARAADITEGQFTLPFEARWGLAHLAPGPYSFRVKSLAEPLILRDHEGNFVAFVVGHGALIPAKQSQQGYLIVVRRGLMRAVRELHLPELGLEMYFPLPKPEGMMLAQGPYLIQRIPIFLAGG